MNKIIKSAFKYLEEKYNPDVIILYGSYARGDYTSVSDIDILCISKDLNDLNDTSEIEGKTLDVWIKKHSNDLIGKNYLHIKDGIILKDTDQIGSNLLNEAKSFFEKGYEKSSISQKKFLVEWLKKMYKRSIIKDPEGLYRRIWLIKDMLEIYFEINDLWFEGPKMALKWLEENDIYFYNLYLKILKKDNIEYNIEMIIRHIEEKISQERN